jgi:hypothetical protein
LDSGAAKQPPGRQSTTPEVGMNTRTIAIIALIVAVIVLILLLA